MKKSMRIYEGERVPLVFQIDSPAFTRHMLEHVFLRACLNAEISGEWRMRELGEEVGKALKPFLKHAEAQALGIIDESICVVSIGGGRKLKIKAGKNEGELLKGRVEDTNASELSELVEGLCMGMGMGMFIEVINGNDPHHMWESVFRGVGEAIRELRGRENRAPSLTSTAERETAETKIHASLCLGKSGISVHAPSPFSHRLEKLVSAMFSSTPISCSINSRIKTYALSHAVLEDVGITIGIALKKMLRDGIEIGIESYGFCITPITLAAISFEGRPSFHSNIPFSKTDIFCGRAEDIDDFLMGISNGSGATLHLWVRKKTKAENAISKALPCMGNAIRNSFLINPYRKGVIAAAKGVVD
ncbi:MAG: hypothetical protein QXP42_00175 [Candidatus Micrarchaeia archaeon]